MKNMAFVPELARFLRTTGCIYTVRAYKYTGSVCEVEGTGKCTRSLVRQVYRLDELKEYVASSGFALPSEWFRAIRSFIKSGQAMYLYKVEVIK